MYFLNYTMVFPGQLYLSPLFIKFYYTIKEKLEAQENISTHSSTNQFMTQKVRSVKNIEITVTD